MSIFSSARYLLTNEESDLWRALALPLAGLMFDFFDGKVARWRNSSSLLGQELDSLADLVSDHFTFRLPFIPFCKGPATRVTIIIALF